MLRPPLVRYLIFIRLLASIYGPIVQSVGTVTTRNTYFQYKRLQRAHTHLQILEETFYYCICSYFITAESIKANKIQKDVNFNLIWLLSFFLKVSKYIYKLSRVAEKSKPRKSAIAECHKRCPPETRWSFYILFQKFLISEVKYEQKNVKLVFLK